MAKEKSENPKSTFTANGSKIGRIIWHDLFSSEPRRSMDFYRRVAGWQYETEHATDFAWGGGEKDFILALLDGEAGAGFTQTPESLPNTWIAYVEVADVDASFSQAQKLDATILREPFEVPGVGRNALLEDPAGALIGLAFSRHDYPAPTRQFGPEVYLSGLSGFPAEFYSELFDWELSRASPGTDGDCRVIGPSSIGIGQLLSTSARNSKAAWLPNVRVSDVKRALRKAEVLGARPIECRPPAERECNALLLRDPDDALVCLMDT